MSATNALMLPPYIVPSSLGTNLPSSRTPACSHFLISLTTRASSGRLLPLALSMCTRFAGWGR